ncbi:MAG: ChuX/HutX family heme-like substrate-binding protein [Nitrosopumilaceae archaeon]|nr:ChuX/HutX family heme-like substrate-binding protein [Nitrosopumilaceae archaeon]
MILDLFSDILKVPDVLFVVKNNGAVSEIRSNSLGVRQKEKWITIGDNDGPAHMHLDSEVFSYAKFVKEQKPERTSYSVRFFDKDDQRILGAFFTKMYDDEKNLRESRVRQYNELEQKYGSSIEFQK